MKRNILSGAISLFVITALFAFTINGSVLPIGSAIPKSDVKLQDVSGKMVTFKSAMKKNGLLVMFTCNTCPFVIKNQQRTKEICAYALQNDIGVVLLNSNEAQRNDDDSYDAMKKYAKEQGYKWYYAMDKDNAIADAFGAGRTPECFLFAKDSKLSYHGAIDDNPTDANNVQRHHLKEAINDFLAGKEVSVKESKSVGCSIKRKA